MCFLPNIRGIFLFCAILRLLPAFHSFTWDTRNRGGSRDARRAIVSQTNSRFVFEARKSVRSLDLGSQSAAIDLNCRKFHRNNAPLDVT
ncbi:hypothetical protein C8R45DRAFT_954280 [Mycena sanguinolenta]|nr:hypothetical protein C8R45DRAFT_954280 [Mycena sanguinolenta]